MPLTFPSSPTVGQQSTQNGRTYQWSGSAWELVVQTATGTAITDASLITTGTLDTARIAAGSLAYAKVQNVSASDRILGRSSAGAGTIEEIACSSAGRSLISGADATAQRTTLGLGTMATQASTSYVAKSGDTMTGQLRVPAGTTTAPGLSGSTGSVGIAINRNNNNYIEFLFNGSQPVVMDSNGTTFNGQATFTNPYNYAATQDYKSVPWAGTCAAWVNFDGRSATQLARSGTYSMSGTTTCTCTITNHGLNAGSAPFMVFSGGPLNGTQQAIAVATVIDANTFTFTAGSVQTGTGTVTIYLQSIRGSGNVSSISRVGIGDYQVNFVNPMPDANYAVLAWGSNAAGIGAITTIHQNGVTTNPTATVRLRVTDGNSYSTYRDEINMYVAIIR